MLALFAEIVERAGNRDINYSVLINMKSVSGYYQSFIIDKAVFVGWGLGEEKMLSVSLNYTNK